MTVSTQNAPSPVRDFLGEFALAVHRYLIYPEDHPLLAQNAQKVLQVLDPARPEGGAIEVTVAGSRLLVAAAPEYEGPKHGELAAKLRDMGIGGIGIQPTADLSDIQALLEFLSARSRSGEDALPQATSVGARGLIEIRPISLSGLEISWDEDRDVDTDRLAELWQALDTAVARFGEPPPDGHHVEAGGTGGDGEGLGGDGEEDDDAAVRRLTDGVVRSAGSPKQSALAVGYIRQLLTAVGKAPQSKSALMIRRRLGALISALDPETIRKLAAAAGNVPDTAGFVADVGVLGDEAVARVLKAVSDQSARALTSSLSRLFGKMAHHSSAGSGRIARETQRALRRSLLALLKEWSLEDPNPTEYGASLERISQKLIGDDADWTVAGGREPERIIQMSLELATFGPLAERAAEHLLFATPQGLTTLVDLMEGEPETNPAVQELARIIYEPDRILMLGKADDIETSTLDALVERLGDRAIEPLLAVISEAESRTVRRKVFDRLVAFGSSAAEAALKRLPDERWYVTRNLLSLARKAGYHFAWFDPDPYWDHPEATVRREAYLLGYLDPKRRTSALAAALKESDERILNGALAELEAGVPAVVASHLAEWVTDPDEPQERRIAAVRALQSSRAPSVLDALVRTATTKTRILRRVRLKKELPLVIPILEVLLHSWSKNPKAQQVLLLGKRSSDPKVRLAAQAMESA